MAGASIDGLKVPRGLIAIGASWGGLGALQRLLAALPRTFEIPLVVVQHRGKEGDGKLSQVLQRSSTLPVVEVCDKQPVEGGRVYLAPPDYHVLVEGLPLSHLPAPRRISGSGAGVGPPGAPSAFGLGDAAEARRRDYRTFALSVDPPVSWARPSIDALFESVAQAFGPQAVGVVLTGAGRDGVTGLCAIRDAGGVTVVQDPKTAEAPQLPEAAVRVCRPAHVLPLEEIAPFLVQRFGAGQPSRSSVP